LTPDALTSSNLLLKYDSLWNGDLPDNAAMMVI